MGEPLITLPFNWGDVCPEAVYDYEMTQDSVTSFVSKPTTPKSISTRKPSEKTRVKATTTREPLTQTPSEKSIRPTSQIPRTQSSSSSEIQKKKITTFHPLQER